MSQLPPKKALRDIGRKWPQAWHQVKHFRAGKGKDLPDWPIVLFTDSKRVLQLLHRG